MSNETPQPPENDGALDLSGLNFGPAWARDPAESKSLKKFKNRGDRDDRPALRPVLSPPPLGRIIQGDS